MEENICKSYVSMHAKSLQLYPTLCEPRDCSPRWDFSVHGILQEEYWSGLLCPPPEDLPDPGIEPVSPSAPELQADSLLLSHQGSPSYV